MTCNGREGKLASKREVSKRVLQPDGGFVAVVGVVKPGHPVVLVWTRESGQEDLSSKCSLKHFVLNEA